MEKLINFLKNEEGVGMIEYVLLAACIAVACIAAMTQLAGTGTEGGGITGLFGGIEAKIEGKTTGL